MNDVRTMGELCAGIGGLGMGLERALGCETVWQVEFLSHRRAVLAAHWPTAKRFDDVEASGGHFVWRNVLTPVDLICFGSPCTDVSSAGKRVGLTGPKSRLYFECARIVSELLPEFCVVENVSSGASRWVDAVRQDLEQRGYASLPVPVSAADCGAPHRRGRIFIVAHLDRSDLRQQSGGAAGRTGATRHSLQSLAKLGDWTSSDAHNEQGNLRTEARSEGADASGVGETDASDSLLERRARAFAEANERWAQSSPGSWRPPVPRVLRMADGFSARAHRANDRARIAALGDSCCPPQAEVVGHVIRILIEAERKRTA